MSLKVSGEEFGKLARAYVNKDLAIYVQKLESFSETLLRKKTKSFQRD